MDSRLYSCMRQLHNDQVVKYQKERALILKRKIVTVAGTLIIAAIVNFSTNEVKASSDCAFLGEFGEIIFTDSTGGIKIINEICPPENNRLRLWGIENVDPKRANTMFNGSTVICGYLFDWKIRPKEIETDLNTRVVTCSLENIDLTGALVGSNVATEYCAETALSKRKPWSTC